MADVERYARFEWDGEVRFVRVDGDRASLLDAAPWLGGTTTGEAREIAELGPRLAPVTPSKIFGIGRSYRAHAAELSNPLPTEPLVFSKPPTSILAPGGTVVLPPESDRVDHEGELGVVVAKRVRRLAPGEGLAAVFGLTIVCDVTARDLQSKDKQWTRAKGFDTFCPVGPEVVRGVDPSALEITLCVDGEERQRGNTRDLVFDVGTLVEYLSAFSTLEPGDLIATGTPAGVGPLSDGNRVAVTIDALGTLDFGVAAERR